MDAVLARITRKSWSSGGAGATPRASKVACSWSVKIPRKVSTAKTWCPICRSAFATWAPLAMETSRSELLPPNRTAIFIVGIDIERHQKNKSQSRPRCLDEELYKTSQKKSSSARKTMCSRKIIAANAGQPVGRRVNHRILLWDRFYVQTTS
jgi:hypothetical protein